MTIRRIMSGGVVLAVVAGLLGFPSHPAANASSDAFVTLGLLPVMTREEMVTLRGTAPMGSTVVVAVNGIVVDEFAVDKTMAVYKGKVPLVSGENRLVASVKGTTATTSKEIFRATASFTDITKHWARDSVEILATLGVVQGHENGEFRPQVNSTRGEFARQIVLGVGLKPEFGIALTFADVAAIAAGDRAYVATAVKYRLLGGYDDNTFRPNQPVKRVEMAVLLARALRLKGVEPTGTDLLFTDEIPAWAQVDVNLAVRARIISGFADKSFRGNNLVTRVEAAVMIHRLMKAWRPTTP